MISVLWRAASEPPCRRSALNASHVSFEKRSYQPPMFKTGTLTSAHCVVRFTGPQYSS